MAVPKQSAIKITLARVIDERSRVSAERANDHKNRYLQNIVNFQGGQTHVRASLASRACFESSSNPHITEHVYVAVTFIIPVGRLQYYVDS